MAVQGFNMFSSPQMQTQITFPQAQQPKKRVNYAKITGYTATVLGVGSAIAGNRKKIELHKYLAYAAGIITAAHIGVIEWFHHKKAK